MARRRRSDTTGRSEALRILDMLESGREHSHALLARLPADMDDRERRLATELVYGVLRRRSAIDRSLERHSSRPLDRITLTLLNALRLTLYQILFLSRIPAPAAVDEGVRLVRARLGRSRAAFANGVLRSACREREERAAGEERGSPGKCDADALAEEHSFPPFMVRRFLRRYGPGSTVHLLETLNRPAPITLRIRGNAIDSDAMIANLREEGIAAIPSPLLPGALRVTSGAPQHTASFRAGSVYIQDEASQLVAELVRPFPTDSPVVDLCAAPGGKILAIADALPRESPCPIAADRSLARLRLLRDNVSRGGSAAPRCVVMDARRPALRGTFRRVLLDAPCSGTGIIRRHPEIRWRRSEEAIDACARRQEEMLEAAWGLVAPGGRLIYAVCSLEPEEGPERIAALREVHPEIVPIDARECLPTAAHALVDGMGCLVTLPHRDEVDGFYAAVLERC